MGADGAWGEWSAAWTFTIDTVKPAKPTLLDPANTITILINQPIFDWDDVVDALDHYDLQVDDVSTFSSPIITVSVTDSAYPVIDALPDDVYYWRVQTVDAAGNASGWTAVWNVRINAEATPTPILSTPTNGGATNDATPTFNWGAVPGATLYRIQVDEDPCSPTAV